MWLRRACWRPLWLASGAHVARWTVGKSMGRMMGEMWHGGRRDAPQRYSRYSRHSRSEILYFTRCPPRPYRFLQSATRHMLIYMAIGIPSGDLVNSGSISTAAKRYETNRMAVRNWPGSLSRARFGQGILTFRLCLPFALAPGLEASAISPDERRHGQECL